MLVAVGVHQVESYLMRQAETIQHAGIKANWSFGYGMPGAKIIETAHSQQVSLIVMTTQGCDSLVRWRLGSVAEEVLHDGRLPVLLVPSSKVDPTRSQIARTADYDKRGASMNIGIPKEVQAGETRVALIPSLVPLLKKDQHEVLVEVGAGAKAYFSDALYVQAGAHAG